MENSFRMNEEQKITAWQSSLMQAINRLSHRPLGPQVISHDLPQLGLF